MGGQHHGVIAVHKPRGCTSHDVVAKVRRWLKEKRVGHAGTLDPDADGLLLVCVGQATRIASYLQEARKSYESVFQLGIGSDTDDADGAIIAWEPCPQLRQADVESILPRFQGAISQQVPRYAAVRVEGERLHKLARQGIAVTPPSRVVQIFSYKLENFFPSLFPELRVSVTCGSGTYIRSLARDLGSALGVPCRVRALRRTASGALSLADAYSLEALERMALAGAWEEMLLPIDRVLPFFPSVMVAAEDRKHILDGWGLEWEGEVPASPVRVYTEDGHFCALYQVESGGSEARPAKVFAILPTELLAPC